MKTQGHRLLLDMRTMIGKGLLLKGLSVLVLFILLSNFTSAQTTYVWNATGGGDFQNAGSWTPSRSAQVNTDILQFNDGNTYIVTNVPTQTIGRLKVSGNTNVTLKPNTGGAATLTINTAVDSALAVTSGSTLVIDGVDAATDRALTLTTTNSVGLTAQIDGTIKVSVDNAQTAAYGVFTKGGASATININNGGTYQHDVGNASGVVIPTCTWNSGSTCYVTGIVGTAPTGITQNFYDLTWNCTGQTVAVAFNATFSIQNNLTITTTNSGSIKHCSNSVANTLTIGGDLSIAAGKFYVKEGSGDDNQAVNITGNVTVSGGTLYVNAASGGNTATLSCKDITVNGGTLEMNTNATYSGAILCTGNFTHTSGTIQNTGGGPTAITLSKTTGTQTLESTGQTGLITWSVAGSNAQCNIASNKTFVCGTSATFTIANGTSDPDLLIDGTFTFSGTTLTKTGTATVSSTGRYNHNVNNWGAGKNLPSFTWSSGSTVGIIGITNSTTITGIDQSFYNVVYNCASQGAIDVDFTQGVGTRTITIGGTLTIISSGSGSLSFGNAASGTVTMNLGALDIQGGTVVFNNNANLVDLNITNAFTISGGTVSLDKSSSGTNNTIDVGGDFTISGGTTTLNSYSGASTAASPTLTVTGNFSQSAGTFNANSSASGSGSSAPVVNITGNLTTSGTATFYGTTHTTGRPVFNIQGSVDLSGGTTAGASSVTSAATCLVTMNLTGTGNNNLKLKTGLTYNTTACWKWTVSSGRTINLLSNIELGCTGGAASFTNNGTLIMDTYTFPAITTAAAAFTNASGATLKTGHSGGIAALGTASGCILVTNARTYHAGGIYVYNGSVAQATGNGLPATLTATGGLTIENSEAITSSSTGVTLTQTTTMSTGTVVLTSGILTSASGTLLTITNTATSAISNGSASTYVSGPMKWSLSTTAGDTYIFPIGKSGKYLPAKYTGNTVASQSIQPEAYTTFSGGSISTPASSYLGGTYWTVNYTQATTVGVISLGSASLGNYDLVTTCETVNGVYQSLGGSISGNFINSALEVDNHFVVGAGSTKFYAMADNGGCATLSGTIPIGPNETLTSLTQAISLLTSCGYSGNIILELQTDYNGTSTYETFPITFGSGLGSEAAKTITVRPETGASGLTITKASSGASIISIDAAAYIIIDGRPNGEGTTSQLTISNTQAAAASNRALTIQNNASNNTIKYCSLKSDNNSVANDGTAGVVFLGSGASGNSSNTIDNCTITYASAATACLMVSYNGSASTANTSNTISNCILKNFANHGVWCSTKSSGFTISSNQIYSATTTGTGGSYLIYLNAGTSYDVKNNTVGGTEANYGGATYFTPTSGDAVGIYIGSITGAGTNYIRNNTIEYIRTPTTPYGIYLNAATSSTLYITNNTIAYINSSNAAGGSSYGMQSTGTCTSLALHINKNNITNITTKASNNGETSYGLGANVASASSCYIYNNHIDIACTYRITGMTIGGCAAVLYNNTISVSGGIASDAYQKKCLNFANDYAYEVKNNIFSNTCLGGSSSASSWCVYSSAGAGATATHSYNYYYYSGAFAAEYFDAGSKWGAESTGKQTGAITFNSNGSVASSVGTVAAAGTDLSGATPAITDDIIGASRATAPYLGCYEGISITFYSKSAVSTDANTLSNWNSDKGGTGATPGAFNTANYVFIVQSGHQCKPTGAFTGASSGYILVEDGGALDINAQTLSTWGSIQLTGTGVSSSGALYNSSSSAASCAIPIILNNNATIASSGSGGLTLTGGITGTGYALTVDGANATTISTAGINTSTAGSLIKNGAGTLTITANGDYTGATTVNAGLLNIQSATATGTTAGGVTVASGAALQLQGASVGAEALTLNGTGISTDGALRFISGTNVWGGAITLGSATRINADAGTNSITGGITGIGNALTIGGAGDVTISGTGINTSTAGTLTKDGVGTLTLSAASDYTGTTTLSNGTISLGSTLASTVDVGAGGSLSINHATIPTFGTLNATSTVNYALAGSQTVSNGATYGNLIIGGGGDNTKTLGGTITVAGNLTIDGSTALDVSATPYNINLAGNWTNNGTFTYQTGTVTLNGTNQNVNTTTFHNLTSGGSDTKTLGGNITVRNTLDFAADSKIATGGNTLTLGVDGVSNGSVTNGSATRYIMAYDNGGTIGYLKRFTTSAAGTVYDFPIGDATKYTPFTFTLTTGTLANAYLTVNTKSSKISGMPVLTSYLNRAWTYTPNGITEANYSLTVKYDINGASDVVGTEGLLIPIKLSGSTWYVPTQSTLFTGVTKQGSGSVNATEHTLSWTSLSTFSEVGAGGDQNVTLPVEFLSVKAICKENNHVLIEWSTASETNNDFFTVERSADSKEFTPIATVYGAGNSNQISNYNYLDLSPENNLYYRIKQTDFDGKFDYSKVVAVRCDDLEEDLDLYYSNENDQVLLKYLASTDQQASVSIINMHGYILSKETINFSEGINSKEFNMHGFAPGTYIIRIEMEAEVVNRKFVKTH